MELVTRLYNVSGGTLDPQQIQNLAIKAEDLGQVNIGELARFLPRTLKPGEVAGLDLAQTSGVFALLSQVLKPELAATATEGILTRLAAPSEEAQKILAAGGIGKDASAMERLSGLADIHRQTSLSAAQLRALVGEGPAAAGLPTLLDQYDRLESVQAEIQAATRPGAEDLGAAKVGFLESTLPGFEEGVRTRQAEQRLAAARRTSGLATEEERSQAIRLELERAMVEAGYSPAKKDLALWSYDKSRWAGNDPISALNFGTPPMLLTDPDETSGRTRQEFMAGILRNAVPGGDFAVEDMPLTLGDRVSRAVSGVASGIERGFEQKMQEVRAMTDWIGLTDRRENVSVTVVGTQYNDRDPLAEPPRDVDLND